MLLQVATAADSDLDHFIFENYLFQGGIGRLYGLGGVATWLVSTE